MSALDPDALLAAIKREVASVRAEGRLPTELLLEPAAWNALRRDLEYRALGARMAVVLDGLPCALTVGCPPPGYVVRSVEPRE